MSLLSDSEITLRCQLPRHLVNFIAYIKNLSPIGNYKNPDDYNMIEEILKEGLNSAYSKLPLWSKSYFDSFRTELEVYMSIYGSAPMIEPFLPHLVRTTDDEGTKIISYGLSSYGYDARLTEEVKTFTNINGGIIDPKNFDKSLCVDTQIFTAIDGSRYVIIPPNGFILGTTVEYFRIPRDVTVICLGKSTIARASCNVIVTPLEAEWEGNVTIEVANTSSLPVKVYLNEGICQFLFLQSEYKCKTSYKDRGGKYQSQKGLTLPRV